MSLDGKLIGLICFIGAPFIVFIVVHELYKVPYKFVMECLKLFKKRELSAVDECKIETIESSMKYIRKFFEKGHKDIYSSSMVTKHYIEAPIDTNNTSKQIFVEIDARFISTYIKEPNRHFCTFDQIVVWKRDIPRKTWKHLRGQFMSLRDLAGKQYKDAKQLILHEDTYNRCREMLKITDDSINDIVLGADEDE